MSRRWLLSLFCLFCLVAILLFVQLTNATATLQVNESTTRILFDEKQTVVSVVVTNSLGKNANALIKLELIDPDDDVEGRVEHAALIKPGTQTLTIPFFSFSLNDGNGRKAFLWYRLRYHVSPAKPELDHFAESDGVISVSEIAPQIFRLQVTSPSVARRGMSYRVRARAVHPITLLPVKDTKVTAELDLDLDKGQEGLKKSALTGTDGYATFDFVTPRAIDADEFDLKVTGERGVIKESVESVIDIEHRLYGMINTDKSLYQPGQTMHARLMVFDETRRALANEEVTIKISDPESETVFRTTLSTSRFGIASADWAIPQNTRLGDYRLEVSMENPDYDDTVAYGEIKISRYDLPNFTVEIKPDRSYYKAGLDANVEVRANYLFGQPVKHGRVRVVRETERRWDYQEQEWKTEEGEQYEGETEADGRFVARIKLHKEHQELAAEDYLRFRDLSYAAYFTDPTTNRTEQRRFDVRLTKEPIHVYILEGSTWQNKNHPLQFYISTSYADGSPASCEVVIDEDKATDDGVVGESLGTVKTNRLGVAKVSNLQLAQGIGEDQEHTMLKFTARDAQGNMGRHFEDLYYSEHPLIRLHTEKALYRQGEPIRVNVESSSSNLQVAVDVTHEGKVTQSELLQLTNGSGSLVIPYRAEFKNEVSIAAYSTNATDPDSLPFTVHTVYYPYDHSLRLDAILSQATYRPGEEASVDFLTRLANGKRSLSALGVVVFDKAVEERARTGNEYASSFGFHDPYLFLRGGERQVAGITRKTLDQLDLKKPVSEEINLVAELLLNTNTHAIRPRLLTSGDYPDESAKVFGDLIREKIKNLSAALEDEYSILGVYPTNEFTLRQIMTGAGLDFDELRDPWGMPYRVSFQFEGPNAVMELHTSAADKRFGSADDFTALRITRPYFQFVGQAIDRAVARYHSRTGNFIRDAGLLKSELWREGISFEALRDPWGQPYQLEFGVDQTKYSITVRSSGPDGTFSVVRDQDDFNVWTSRIDYTVALKRDLGRAFDKYLRTSSRFPQDDVELSEALRHSGLDRETLVDPWGSPLYSIFEDRSAYVDRVVTFDQAKHGEKAIQRTEITPVTQTVTRLHLRSSGPDKVQGNRDDFDVAFFSRIKGQIGRDAQVKLVRNDFTLQGSTGAITGTVTDPNGAAVAGAKVIATNKLSSTARETETDDEGCYLFKNLTAGIYELRISAPGFSDSFITGVRVRSSNITEVNVSIEVGTVSQTVTITAGSSAIDGVNTAYSAATSVSRVTKRITTQASTPRLREYFPETLVWQPAIETDSGGRARLRFKLADNITTWKMSVVGSTEDGQLGFVEKEIRAFQPFFVDHDPPRILTEGDEISLPVVVRNYLERSQPVRLSIKQEDWFNLLGAAEQQTVVGAGDASREIFGFKTTASVKDGKQRITAIAADDNDAIEKPVTVHPDGEELATTVSDLVGEQGAIEFAISEHAIPKSAQAQLKIYPNLLAHVMESVEAIMQRPYGCGEQTISSTFPSLLLLKHHKRTGQDFPLRNKAEKYLRAGYDRLLNYRDPSGGFTYWGRGEPDVALTAYALRFLTEASDLIEVEQSTIEQTRKWLISKQSSDGSWPVADYGPRSVDERRKALLTAYVARVLALTANSTKSSTASPGAHGHKAVTHALNYLTGPIVEIDEPYLLASFALAAHDAGDARFDVVLAKLRTLAKVERDTTYWSLETNTPFYGWGLAGRVETSALVVQALARAQTTQNNSTLTPPVQAKPPHSPAMDNASQTNDQLIRSGLLFLLRKKDRYGVWYSTQATINVLDALLTTLDRHAPGNDLSQLPAADIFVNGRNTGSVSLPSSNKMSGPVLVDLSRFLHSGTNRVEIKRRGSTTLASAQVVTTYYIPWTTGERERAMAHHASGLRLLTSFDKTVGKTGDEFTCHVKAEREGFRGYGMMLAEIGLPPGADVDRASLDKAMSNSGWGFSQYDVLPDRVVMYLWPSAGGLTIDFKFRPRYGLQAKTASSVLYDYYNPEARVVVVPETFVIK